MKTLGAPLSHRVLSIELFIREVSRADKQLSRVPGPSRSHYFHCLVQECKLKLGVRATKFEAQSGK